MNKLKKGRIYIGKYNDEPCRYLGKEKCEDSGEMYHQFENVFIKPEDVVIGHGQTDEQVLEDEYKLAEIPDLLYGRP